MKIPAIERIKQNRSAKQEFRKDIFELSYDELIEKYDDGDAPEPNKELEIIDRHINEFSIEMAKFKKMGLTVVVADMMPELLAMYEMRIKIRPYKRKTMRTIKAMRLLHSNRKNKAKMMKIKKSFTKKLEKLKNDKDKEHVDEGGEGISVS